MIIKEFQSKKQKRFLDIILINEQLITSEKVTNITFIMEFAKTLDVVNRLHSNDKLDYIAKLFKKSFVERSVNEYDANAFEEHLHRLEYLSEREIKLLVELYKIQNKEEQNKEQDEQGDSNNKLKNNWIEFKQLVSREYNIDEDDIISIFSGLSMSGYCRQSQILNFSGTQKNNPFFITSYFEKLIHLIFE